MKDGLLKVLYREQLDTVMSGAYQRPLTLMVAPSGYGKTTSMRMFLQKRPNIIGIWQSFQLKEEDGTWLWHKLAEKFAEVDGELTDKMKNLGLPQTPRDIKCLVDLLQHYIKKPVCLVLDDYQEEAADSFDKLIKELVYEDIPYFHIVILSRTYPDISYEDMQIKGYCTVLNQYQLKLSEEETKRIFRLNEVSLTADEFDVVYRYTDGWISAVYLIALEYKRSGGVGASTSAVHLLKQVVYEKFPPKLQQILMKVSMLDYFYLEEAVYISECDVLPDVLKEYIVKYGFVQYDPKQRFYGMHALLRVVTYAELCKTDYDRNRIFQRAGEWNEQNGQYSKAVRYYYDAGQIRRIFELLSGNNRNIIWEAGKETVRKVVESTSLEIRLQYPVAYLWYIYLVIVEDDPVRGEELYLEACGKYRAAWAGRKEYTRLLGEMALIDAVLQFNNLAKMNAAMKRAYELLDHTSSAIFNHSLLTYGTPHPMLLFHRQVGSFKEEIGQSKEYAGFYMQLFVNKGGDWDELYDAEYEMAGGNVQVSLELSEVICEKAEFRQQKCVWISGCYMKLRALLFLGRQREFEQEMEAFMEHMQGETRSILRIDYELAYSFLYAVLNRPEKMAEWLRTFDLQQCGRMVESTGGGCITYGMLLLRNEKWIRLETLADQMRLPSGKTTHIFPLIYANLYKAVSLYYRGKEEQAASYLEEAVLLSEADEIRMPFIELGAELKPMLAEYAQENAFVTSLFPYIEQYQESLTHFKEVKEKVELTPREKELMNLVKQGRHNSEIGQELNIALVTVEKTLTGVYRKLQVNNRTAAVAQLEIL